MIKEKYKNLVFQLDALQKVGKIHKFNLDIHGYEKYTSYPEFRLIWGEKLEFPNLLFIDEIEHFSYGFHIEDEQYDETSELIKGQYGSELGIESVTFEPFKNYINYNFNIKGEPKDIDIIAESHPFIVELVATGCPKTSPFWKQSLYQSYLMYKGNNITSSFMNLFFAFEGLLRFHTSFSTPPQSIHKIYKNYTTQDLPLYLDAYRKIRNQVSHGNENIASKLTVEDLEILIDTIQSLEEGETPIGITEYTTLAISEGMLLP